MKYKLPPFIIGVVLLAFSHKLIGQSSPNCTTASDDDVHVGEVFFNYGSATNAFDSKTSTNFTIGQTAIGSHADMTGLNGGFGFWSRFLAPPLAPAMMASEGDFTDIIALEWIPDPLSPSSTDGFKIYRDGFFLEAVDDQTFTFVDFNVIAGKFYSYEVSGVNQFGEGTKAQTLGFLNPNGVVTGQIKSFSGNPVPEAVVTLTPTLGAAIAFDGVDDMAFTEYNAAFPRRTFTLSCWVKLEGTNDHTGIFDFGSHLGKNWWLHTLPDTTDKGIRFGIGRSVGDVTEMSYVFPSATEDDWHYVAATYNGSSLLLYVDGELIETAVASIAETDRPLFFGKKSDHTAFFNGKLDELRMFDRQLSQTELQTFMNRTVSANTEGLVGYWKFDEGIGTKAFGQSDLRTKIYFCDAKWTDDKPGIINAGITDETGFYQISGINYGGGTTLTATPGKVFHFNQSLEFNAANSAYADLTDFDLKDTASVTAIVEAFDFSGNQAILSKADAGGNNLFLLCLNAGNLDLIVNGQTQTIGSLDMGFHHLAVNLFQAGTSLTAHVYKNGTLLGSSSFTGVPTDWTGMPWKLGAKADGIGGHTDYFTGLIDEVAFFETTLTTNEISTYSNIGTDAAHSALISYFNLNEGSGSELKDMGSALTGSGMVHGAQWSTVAAHEQSLPHEFQPSSRLLTLNPNTPSIDQVDFTDLSTIQVSGFVRIKGTDCFEKGVEILVNGASNFPQIFTDKDGKFTADFDPGKDVILTPKFEDHSFTPAFWELENLSSPVAGILFQDKTKRTVSGQVAGGECLLSIIPSGAIVKVKLATLNGCHEQVKELPAGDGSFIFENVPPDSVTIAVTHHSNDAIKTYFMDVVGGRKLDLRMKNETVDFIYFSPPQLELSPLDTNSCGNPVLTMLDSAETVIKVFEEYSGGKCYLDTAALLIENNIASLIGDIDTIMTQGSFTHKFRVEEPNIVSPYLKTLQVTAEAKNVIKVETLSAVVLGRRPTETTYAATSPQMPLLILRDPPGDGSYAFWEEDQEVCKSWTFDVTTEFAVGAHVTVSLGKDWTATSGTPFFSVDTELDATIDLGLAFTATTNFYQENTMEACISTTKRISTSDSDDIVGSSMGGDVYYGGAMNILYGITKELGYDTTGCGYKVSSGLTIFPNGFETEYIYTEAHILNDIIPSLELAGDAASVLLWQGIIAKNTEQKQSATFSKNITFDAGVIYEESETITESKNYTFSWHQQFDVGFASEFGFTADGVGIVGGVNIDFTQAFGRTDATDSTTTTTIGYVLADDDVSDDFSINVKKDATFQTPVFDVIAGQSSCPHEPGTLARDGVQLTAPVTSATDVPMNDAAVFTLNLGNTSSTNESRTYELSTDQISNPNGTIIRFNGESAISVTLDP